MKTGHRVYDSEELYPYHRQPSGVASKNNRWEVHRDPYDITRVWIRDHPAGGGWITAYWKLLGGKPAPFGELAWDHARADLRRQGRQPVRG